MKKSIVWVISCLVMIVTMASCTLTENFHEIDPGKYYRSGQLSGKSLEKAINYFGIKTVINLRGESDSEWYRDELAVTQRYNVQQVNIAMSAKRLPHRKDLIKLLETFENAERPILVHCQGGADRTGEASAIYQMLYMGKTKEEALKMLTIKYFHITKRMPAKRYFIRELWQGAEWAKNDYDPCKGQYKYYDLNDAACTSGVATSLTMDEDT